MLRVTIELISAIDGHIETLGTAEIWNNVSGTPTKGNYSYRIYGKRHRKFGEGSIEGFPRTRLLSWDLLYRILKDCLTSRN
jgi:hypothetical protein